MPCNFVFASPQFLSDVASLRSASSWEAGLLNPAPARDTRSHMVFGSDPRIKAGFAGKYPPEEDWENAYEQLQIGHRSDIESYDL